MDAANGEEAVLKVMEVATICSVPMALTAAIHLRVMDILAQHAGGGQDGDQRYLSASQIASHCKDYLSLAHDIDVSSLDRILKLLASHGLLASSLQAAGSPTAKPTTTYGPNAVSSYLLQTTGEGSLAPLVLTLQDPVFMRCLYSLHESVVDGSVPFTKVHGMKCFSYTQTDARFDQLFNTAMVGHTRVLMHALLETYTGFETINSLVDVGGGVGASLGMITRKYPHIKGINFDQPHVIEAAPNYPGVEHVGGDMFVSVPNGEAIFLKWILHDWSDEHCIKILKNCYNALPKKGKIIVVDAILPDKVEHELGARVRFQMDVLVFAYYEGGKERTRQDLVHISTAAGFSKVEVICNVHPLSVIEIFKGDP